MPIRTHTRGELLALGITDPTTVPQTPAEHLQDKVTETRRSVEEHLLIFRAPDDGRTYAALYEELLSDLLAGPDPFDGAKEMPAQEVDPHLPDAAPHPGTPPTAHRHTRHRSTQRRAGAEGCADDARRLYTHAQGAADESTDVAGVADGLMRLARAAAPTRLAITAAPVSSGTRTAWQRQDAARTLESLGGRGCSWTRCGTPHGAACVWKTAASSGPWAPSAARANRSKLSGSGC